MAKKSPSKTDAVKAPEVSTPPPPVAAAKAVGSTPPKPKIGKFVKKDKHRLPRKVKKAAQKKADAK